jgi:ribosome-associated toxin RatA of RatAB toxin-antitoxin module
MGKWQTSVIVPGPREQVFELFTDRENYRKLVAPVGATLVTAGTESRQGAGAIHKLGVGPIGISEQIVSVQPGRSFTYRAVSRLPVHHYIGTVDFHDHPKGTRVDYTLDVEAALPLPGPVLQLMVKGLAGGLARGATRQLRRAARQPGRVGRPGG